MNDEEHQVVIDLLARTIRRMAVAELAIRHGAPTDLLPLVLGPTVAALEEVVVLCRENPGVVLPGHVGPRIDERWATLIAATMSGMEPTPDTVPEEWL